MRAIRRKANSSAALTSRFLKLLFPYQRAWLLDGHQFKIGLWARQTGKDYTCAAEAALDCIIRPHKHWLILACSERQAVETLLKAGEWARKLEALVPEHSVHFQQSATEIRFENGSRITALPALAETVRGYSANVILTEFAFHDDPDAIYQAIFPSVTNPLRGGQKKLRIISTPSGHGNLFHKLWTNARAHGFQAHRVTIHDAVAQGLPLNIDQLKSGLVHPEAWAQEYECQFIDQTSVLLPYALIEQCESPDATETAFDLSRASGEIFVGIDFGRKHDLTACWILERVGQQLWTREVLTLERMSTPQQAELLAPRLLRARRVCLDYTGSGIGLGDLLTAQFGTAPYGKVELCNFTTGLKDELFPKVRAALEARRIWLPANPAIREDLHSMHRVVSDFGKISYRATHSSDGHSDRCTALALALRASESTPALSAPSSVGPRNSFLARR